MTKNVQINGRVEPELLARVRQEAKANRRNLGQETACLIEEALALRDRVRKTERRQAAPAAAASGVR